MTCCEVQVVRWQFWVSGRPDDHLICTLVDTFSKKFGLTINKSKTEVQVINREKISINIQMDGQLLNHGQVENLIYLGVIISETPTSETDIKRRVGLAMGAIQRLNPIWNSKDIKRQTKLYRVLVLSIASYGAETWTLKKSDEQR